MKRMFTQFALYMSPHKRTKNSILCSFLCPPPPPGVIISFIVFQSLCECLVHIHYQFLVSLFCYRPFIWIWPFCNHLIEKSNQWVIFMYLVSSFDNRLDSYIRRPCVSMLFHIEAILINNKAENAKKNAIEKGNESFESGLGVVAVWYLLLCCCCCCCNGLAYLFIYCLPLCRLQIVIIWQSSHLPIWHKGWIYLFFNLSLPILLDYFV